MLFAVRTRECAGRKIVGGSSEPRRERCGRIKPSAPAVPPTAGEAEARSAAGGTSSAVKFSPLLGHGGSDAIPKHHKEIG